MIPVILGVTLIVMLLLELTPGDPARQLLGNFATEEEIAEARETMGLNKPLLTRYVDYLSGVLRGNLGVSYFTKDSVWNDILVRFPFMLRRISIPGRIMRPLSRLCSACLCRTSGSP
jgi:peptide/nickel transport system permease protein